MSTVKEHYENVLSDVYIWMFDGFESGLNKNTEFFKMHKVSPTRSGVAIDLGAGCGFQSIPLAKAGFTVTAVDLDNKLLSELECRSDQLPIKIVQDDLVDFDKHTEGNAELIVCMTDTLCHLETKAKVLSLFEKVMTSLEESGQFILTFRDLSFELSDLDRFIPVKSDDDTVFTCFLEYEPETVKVHDLVYRKKEGNWCLSRSYYRKLRLSKEWIDEQLSNVGFTQIESTVDKGFVTVIAVK
ncbi:methyltransferase domain-containing protein [uncultured Desulfobacter sp.]|uniref:class I SAM-dependent methyltransferase n=1 Tax=uncultured Desulfobacter sp. TaxID=240139 RepID=UPI002AAB0400|nr:methyltransferase domain-containing protein [uncultured Desulfobacter sp.]